MLKCHPLSAAIIISSLTLAACNSNDEDKVALPSKATTIATTTVTVTPSLGKILNGRVSLKNAKTGAVLAPTQVLTPAKNGTATFTVPVSQLAEPVLAEVLPTAAGILEYADEALKKATTITVPVADANKPVLRAATSVTPNANIGVTALTESAVQQAEKAVGGLIAQNINQANAAVKNALNLNFNITQAPIVIGVGEFDKLINAALDAQRRAYAAYLATLAKEAQRMNSTSLAPAYDMAKVLASDFSDGTFDAKQGTTALSFYNASFVNAWINWVQNFYAAFINFNNINMLNMWLDNFNAVTPAAVPIRVVEGIAEYSCNDAAKLRSGSGGQLNIDFVNQRADNLNIDWINFNGGLTRYRTDLATGQTYTIIPTSVTHPWKVSTTQGQCVGIYTATTATKKTITFKTNEVILAGAAAPVDTGNTDTCASLGVNPSTLAAIEDFVGTYDVTASGAATTFQLASNGDITLKGQTSSFKEVCKNPTQNNGQGYRLISNKATILLFRETNNALLAEGRDFTNTTSAGVFEGYKRVTIDPLKPIRTTNGVEEYSCDSWTKIPNGTADGTPIISFSNNLGANTSLTLFGLNSIQKTTTVFTGIPNGETRPQPALKNQFIRVETGGGQCLGVFKATTNDDKTINFKPAGVVEITNTAGANNCTSQGTDNKLGFTNAPSDFCSFSKSTSIAITNPDTYNFFNADKKENVEVTVVNNAVTSVSIENDKYGFACGVGFTACSGIKLNTANTNTIEFIFNNTALSVVNGASQGITVKNGSLIHQLPVVTPPTTATCTGNTNPFGCLTITGTNAPAAIFEHSSEQNFVNNGLPVNSLTTSGVGAVVYRHPQKGSFTEDSIFKVGVDEVSTYSYKEYDANLSPIKQGAYECTANPTTKLCTNLMHRPATKEFVFDDVVFTKVGSTETLIFTGVVKY